jgi:hypothetical protein
MGMQTGPSRANMWTENFPWLYFRFPRRGRPRSLHQPQALPGFLNTSLPLLHTPKFEIAYRLGLLQWVFNTGFSIFVGEIRGVCHGAIPHAGTVEIALRNPGRSTHSASHHHGGCRKGFSG